MGLGTRTKTGGFMMIIFLFLLLISCVFLGRVVLLFFLRFMNPKTKIIFFSISVIFIGWVVFWGSLKFSIIRRVSVLSEDARNIAIFYLTLLHSDDRLDQQKILNLEKIIQDININKTINVQTGWTVVGADNLKSRDHHLLFYNTNVIDGSVIAITRDGSAYWIKKSTGDCVPPPPSKKW